MTYWNELFLFGHKNSTEDSNGICFDMGIIMFVQNVLLDVHRNNCVESIWNYTLMGAYHLKEDTSFWMAAKHINSMSRKKEICFLDPVSLLELCTIIESQVQHWQTEIFRGSSRYMVGIRHPGWSLSEELTNCSSNMCCYLNVQTFKCAVNGHTDNY